MTYKDAIVYWTRSDSNLIIEDAPEKVIKSNEWKNLGDYNKCYAAAEYFKNTFIITSPYDFTLSRDGDSLFSNQSQEWFNHFIDFERLKENIIQISLDYYFYSEEDIEISVTPAFLHMNGFTNNAINLPATMNISKWYRPIKPAFIMKNSIDVKFKDALLYVKFHTDKKIILKQYEETDKLNNYANICGNVKKHKQWLNLTKLYERFKVKNMNKLIMKEIKNNLVE